MLTAFGWAVIAVLGVVLAGAVVFILGFLVSMLVSIAHGFGLGVEHMAERGIDRLSGHPTGGIALHHQAFIARV